MKPVYRLLICLGTLIVNNALAQKLPFTGNVNDSKGVAILGATVLALNISDSSYVSSSITSEKGFFILSVAKEDTYLVKISFIGYKTLFYKTHIPVNDTKSNKFILDEELNKLNEVVVKGTRSITEVKGNQINFNINELLAKSSINAFALLNKAPGIVVTNGERIMLLGQTNILVKLDGKRAFSDVEDAVRFLKNTPAANIDRIEIQYATGAEYESNYASVVNIVMKKNLSNGIKGVSSLGFNQGSIARYLAAVNLNYVKNKFNAYLIASYNHFAILEERTVNQSVIDYKNIYSIYDNSSSKLIPNVEGVRLGGSYDINVESSISFVFGYTHSNKNQVSEYNTNFIDQRKDSIVYAGENTRNNNDKIYTNFSYQFKKLNTKMSIDANFLTDNSKIMSLYNNIINNSFNFNLVGDRLYKVSTANTLFNLSRNFAHAGSIDIGGKLSYTHLNDDIGYQTTGLESLDNILGINSPISYDELVSAGYINATKTIKKVNTSIGIRYEYAHLRGLVLKNNESYERGFPNILPTVSINFPLNDKNKINILYKQFLVRPNYSQLNPSILYVNPYTVLQGNLAIRQYNTYSLSATYSLLDKYILTAKYSYNSNAIPQYVLSRLNDKITKITYDNAISGGGIQAAIYIPFTVAKRWSSYNNINAFRLKYITINDNYSGFDYVNYNFNLSSSNVISLSHNYSLGIDLSYSSGVRINQTTILPISSLDFQISKSLLDQKLNISLLIQDIFYGSIRRGSSSYESTISSFYETADTRRVGINIRYSFGNNKLSNPPQRRSGLEDEENRAKYSIPVK